MVEILLVWAYNFIKCLLYLLLVSYKAYICLFFDKFFLFLGVFFVFTQFGQLLLLSLYFELMLFEVWREVVDEFKYSFSFILYTFNGRISISIIYLTKYIILIRFSTFISWVEGLVSHFTIFILLVFLFIIGLILCFLRLLAGFIFFILWPSIISLIFSVHFILGEKYSEFNLI